MSEKKKMKTQTEIMKRRTAPIIDIWQWNTIDRHTHQKFNSHDTIWQHQHQYIACNTPSNICVLHTIQELRPNKQTNKKKRKKNSNTVEYIDISEMCPCPLHSHIRHSWPIARTLPASVQFLN